jgi:nodulation protein E
MLQANLQRRVVVTGMGALTPLGQSVADFWQSLCAGKSGIGPVDGIAEDLRIGIAARVGGFDPASRLAKWHCDKTIMHSSRFCWLAAAAADEAIAQAGLTTPLENPQRAACIIGSAAGGHINVEIAARDRYIEGKRAVHPMLLPRIVSSTAAAHIGIEYGVKGPTFAVCSSGASAAHAIGLGLDYVRRGLVDVAIVGGADSTLTYSALLACDALHLLSPDGCFPFAKRHNGTVLAEAAGILVLEAEGHARARGARPLAELAGFGMASGSESMLGLNLEAASHAMRSALEDAGAAPQDIGYVNAHGDGIREDDVRETAAIKSVFGRDAKDISISSTKSMHGHALGAAAAIEAIACVKTIESGVVPPTIGLEDADPHCDLDYTPVCARSRKVAHAMCNNVALGGIATSLIFEAVAA